MKWGLSCVIGPLGRLGAAATLGQHCPQMTLRRCTVHFVSSMYFSGLIDSVRFPSFELNIEQQDQKMRNISDDIITHSDSREHRVPSLESHVSRRVQGTVPPLVLATRSLSVLLSRARERERKHGT